jgi:F0F1-type ATP synthase beta subunit
MDPNIVSAEHYEVARGVQKILQVLQQVFVKKTRIEMNCYYL